MKRCEITDAINAQNTIILDCEAKLSSKDYIGTKIAMGVATVDDYKGDILTTEVWRQDIRNANAEIERLKALVPEDDDDMEPEGED